MKMNEYIENVIKTVERRDNAKPEYIQCVKEVFRSLEKVIEQHPEYVEDDLLTRMAEPDRLITFRVAWVTMPEEHKLTEAIVFSLIQASVLTKEDYVFIQA